MGGTRRDRASGARDETMASGAMGPMARRTAAAVQSSAQGGGLLQNTIKVKDGAEATTKLNSMPRELFGLWSNTLGLRWNHAKSEFAEVAGKFNSGAYSNMNMQQFATGLYAAGSIGLFFCVGRMLGRGSYNKPI